MASSHRSRSKTSRPVTSEIAAAESVGVAQRLYPRRALLQSAGLHFRKFSICGAGQSVVSGGGTGADAGSGLLDDAIAWNERDLGRRACKEWSITWPPQTDGPCIDCRFNVVPYRGSAGVLMVLDGCYGRVVARMPRRWRDFNRCWRASGRWA